MTAAPPEKRVGDAYARYALVVLLLVYVVNFLDRQILSILAEDIGTDLGLSDSSIGFLYGTAFAIFYAVFGIPLSRLADIAVRKNIIAGGLALWSAMTALSATARSFGSLALFRFGVGVGESAASPAAFSLLADYFPPRLRATVMAIYSSGVYIGGGIGLFLGGLIVDRWNAAFPPGTAPFGLAGWQAAFLLVGLPGLPLAFWVWTLREPRRGRTESIVAIARPNGALREFGIELAAVLPLVSLLTLSRVGATSKQFVLNLSTAAVIAAVATGLISRLGSPAQWIGLGVGVYIFLTWLQILALRDAASFAMIYRCRAVVYGEIGFGCIGFVVYGNSFWMPSFFIRAHGISAAEAGMFLGISGALGGFIGTTAGGMLSDWLKRRTPRARPFIGIGVALASVPLAASALTTNNLAAALALVFLNSISSSAWIGSAVALANELVLPRMRATASAFYVLCVTFIGLALGPYAVGRISDALAASAAPADALRGAMLIALAAMALAVLFLWLSSRHIENDEASRNDRARALGEVLSAQRP